MDKPLRQEAGLQQPLIRQVLDEMFANLEGRDEFSVVAVEELKRLAKGGELREPAKVASAIKRGGQGNETART